MIDNIAAGRCVIFPPIRTQGSVCKYAVGEKVGHIEIKLNVIVKIPARNDAKRHFHARHVARHIIVTGRIHLHGLDELQTCRHHADHCSRFGQNHFIQRPADGTRLVDGDLNFFNWAHRIFKIVFIQTDGIPRICALACAPSVCHKTGFPAIACSVIRAEHGAVHGKNFTERFIYRPDYVCVGRRIPFIDLVCGRIADVVFRIAGFHAGEHIAFGCNGLRLERLNGKRVAHFMPDDSIQIMR